MTEKKMGVPTASEARRRGKQIGLSDVALDEYVRRGAPWRHRARVEATIQAALEVSEGDHILARAILQLDLAGLCGENHAVNGVHHHPGRRFLSSLGMGNWQERDAVVYRGAAKEALREMGGQVSFEFQNDGALFVLAREQGDEENRVRVISNLPFLMPWIAAEAKRQLGLALEQIQLRGEGVAHEWIIQANCAGKGLKRARESPG